MKKLIIALVTVAFSTAVFAQAGQQAPAKPAMTSEKKMALHCFAMKDGAMTRCMGSKAEPMTKDATLMNGSKVNTKGEVTMKDGKKTTLANGQCILVSGVIGDFDKMHPKMKMDEKK